MKPKDLHHYRNQLLALRSRLRNELEKITETVQSAELPPGEHDQMVSESPDKELSLEHNEENIHRQIKEALQRIDDGTYGVCRDCGGTIAAVRLDVVPYVSYCADCQLRREQAVVTPK